MTTQNLTAKTRRAIKKYGLDACRICWTENVIHGEGGTMCAIASGLHINSTGAAIQAYTEYLKVNEAGKEVTA